jgi:hypothetical protein
MRALRATSIAVIAAVIGVGVFTSPAQADWHGWHRGWHPHGWYGGWGPPAVVIAPRPYYYAPPPVYYAPPPAYYAPPPVYYAPSVALGVTIR